MSRSIMHPTPPGADLRGASFLRTELRGADMKGALTRDADFSYSDLRGARLSDWADARFARFDYALLGDPGTWLHSPPTSIVNCALPSSSFVGADMRHVPILKTLRIQGIFSYIFEFLRQVVHCGDQAVAFPGESRQAVCIQGSSSYIFEVLDDFLCRMVHCG